MTLVDLASGGANTQLLNFIAQSVTVLEFNLGIVNGVLNVRSKIFRLEKRLLEIFTAAATTFDRCTKLSFD